MEVNIKKSVDNRFSGKARSGGLLHYCREEREEDVFRRSRASSQSSLPDLFTQIPRGLFIGVIVENFSYTNHLPHKSGIAWSERTQ